ncbi:MAG TPA: uroporphyrinogen decarboxylase family protein [Planctomycetota bacterium]|nr:uroporphyrinogen decarboxylase family protein [Planctomycetota bacterium]HRR83343.1 uroporphyrinogen decarboxylase family protein [Planctomycetota bacterium]
MRKFASWPRNDIPARLAREMKRRDGLAPVDLDRFWADQEAAIQDPFGAHIPQCPLGVLMSGECVYAELGLEEDYWRYDHDEPWRLGLHRAYNDKAERIVGRRLLSEKPSDPTRRYPAIKGLHDVFEAHHEWHSGSWWLQPCVRNDDELKALLDRVERRLDDGLRRFLLPPNWHEERARLMALGVKPPLYRHQRGPVTFAMSLYSVEGVIFLIADRPDLATRWSRLILRAMLDIARLTDEEAGYTPDTAPHGFSFADDNCCMLTPEMYELFAYPVLKGVFDRYSPNPADSRYQHSDSAMAHILPVLARLGLNGTNFGPTVTVREIRQHLPNAVIHGQLAPYTLMRNESEKIVAEFLRDFEQARATRGLVFATAGSINNGSLLVSMRLIMSAIQHFGRYS